MMHKSPAFRMIGMIAWVFTAVAALIMGLGVLGINVYGMLVNAGLGATLMFLDWAFLIFGAISLVMFVMAVMHPCGCNEGQCNCK